MGRGRKDKGDTAEGEERVEKGRENSTWIFVHPPEFLVTPLAK